MNLMPPDAPPPSGAPAVGPPLPAGEEGAGTGFTKPSVTGPI